MTPHILVVDCSSSPNLLTTRQFVWPIQRSIYSISATIPLSKLKQSSVKGFDAIIFSGCTLKDNGFVSHVKKLSWLKEIDKPMLGICAGHELLGLVFGGKLSSLKQPVIGMEYVTLLKHSESIFHHSNEPFAAYHLNGKQVSVPKGFVCVGKSKSIKNEAMLNVEKKIMGFQFHPEYQHTGFIVSFLQWALS